MSHDFSQDVSQDRTFVHSRLIDAPVERVFSALSDPACLARWWGPNGFRNTFEIFDLRPGGSWRFVMRGPDGTPYANECIFREVLPPRLVVIEHLADVHHFFLTISFQPQGEQTRVGWRQVFDTAQERARIAQWVAPANEQNLDRLQAEVQGAHNAMV